ncbi:hypothetical protein AX14_009168, partial [Amanita brunnescens Koide BX004]
ARPKKEVIVMGIVLHLLITCFPAEDHWHPSQNGYVPGGSHEDINSPGSR